MARLPRPAIAVSSPVALGADWLPSGSTGVLAEIKVARRELGPPRPPIAAADLVHMVTAAAAQIAGLGNHLGALQPGNPADVLVLERHHDDPYENLCLAAPDWAQMVLIGGDITYARTDWFHSQVAPTGETIAGTHRLGQTHETRHQFQARPDGHPR